MTRLTLLLLLAALVVPGAASAVPAPDRQETTSAPINAHGVDLAAQDAKARAVEEYYSSYGEPEPILAQAPAPVAESRTGLSTFAAIGIGVALMLVGGGLGVYAGRSLRPRQIGA